MNYKLIIRPLAYLDLENARDWYDSQRSGRGEEFLVEVQKRLVEVQEAPLLNGKVRTHVRAASLPKSKFLIYYRVEGELVTVIAVQHARAHPKRWRRRK